MRIKPGQLSAELKKGLKPIYFITGDEPLQLGELADVIRKTAKLAGYDNREVISVDANFEWHQLAFIADAMSIFSDKKIIDLRLPSGAPGIDGAKALVAYCGRLQEDNLLLITAGKLASAALKTRWFEALDKQGIVIQVWPLEGQDLINWLQQRLLLRGLSADTDGLRLLATRVEGNLLAAAQEIEKLYVLYGESRLSLQQILDVVADNSRYDVFKLIDSVLSDREDRIVKILSGLRDEGVAAPVVLWALTREARSLIKIKWALTGGQSRDMVYKNNQIWDKRKQIVSNGLNRLSDKHLTSMLVVSAKADRQIKGQESGDAWGTLREICLMFAMVK
jgi:DNA polymerase-3 subunit delta